MRWMQFLLITCFFTSGIQAKPNYEEGDRHFADHSQEQFNPDLLALVDDNGGTYLFRGNLPEINGVFAYNTLMTSIKATLAKSGKQLSDNVQLFDISLLNLSEESEKIEIEEQWVRANPTLSSFWLNSLYGAKFNPNYVPKFIRNYILKNKDIDDLKVFMTNLKNIFDKAYPYDLVIYFHCNAGKDRTGEAAACYLMQYKGYSYKEAMHLNQQIGLRKVRKSATNAIRWYAYYLRDIEKIATIGKID